MKTYTTDMDGGKGSNSPKFTPLLSNAVTPQTTRPKCLCLLHPIMSSLRHYLSFSPHLSSLGDLIFCHVFLIFTSVLLPFISSLLSPPIYMFLVRMGVWWVLSELLNRMHLPRTRKCCETGHAHRIVHSRGGGGFVCRVEELILMRNTIYSWFETFDMFGMLYSLFWMIPWRLNLRADVSEHAIQTPGNHPKIKNATHIMFDFQNNVMTVSSQT